MCSNSAEQEKKWQKLIKLDISSRHKNGISIASYLRAWIDGFVTCFNFSSSCASGADQPSSIASTGDWVGKQMLPTNIAISTATVNEEQCKSLPLKDIFLKENIKVSHLGRKIAHKCTVNSPIILASFYSLWLPRRRSQMAVTSLCRISLHSNGGVTIPSKEVWRFSSYTKFRIGYWSG